MRNLKRLFITAILIGAQAAYGGLPPTTLQGLDDASKSTTFDLVVPASQATRVSGTGALIETGNTNLLRNPNFSAATFNSGWTASAGSLSVNTLSYPPTGIKQSVSIALSAVNGTILTQSVTPQSTSGISFEAGMWVSTTLSNIQVCAMQGSTEYNCYDVDNSGAWAYYGPTMPGPTSGSIGVRLKSKASVTGALAVASAYLGVPRGIFSVNPPLENAVFKTGASTVSTTLNTWVLIPLTVTSDSTNYPLSSNSFTIRSSGKYSIRIEGDVVGNNDSINWGYAVNGGTPVTDSATQTIVLNASGSSSFTSTTFYASLSAGDVITAKVKNSTLARTMKMGLVELRQLTSPVSSAVRSDQTNYGWTAWTPTFTGLGTVTGIDCRYKRDGEDMIADCKFTMGTGTATEARISFPSVGTANVASIKQAAVISRSESSSVPSYALVEPGQSYFTLALASSGGLTKINGSALTASQTISFIARVPITGWIDNGKAPVLTGGITSAIAGSLRTESAEINCDASSSVTNGSWWLSSVGNRSTTSCAITIQSGMFSAAPYTCNFNVKGTTPQSTSIAISSATSVTVYGPSADYDGYLTCTGPR